MGSVLVELFGALVLSTASGSVLLSLTANEHPWGRFQPNSWCIVQTVTVSNIEGRSVQSLQTVRTTLQSIDENSITLQEAETLNLGGRIVEKKPQIVQYDFFHEPIQENVQIRQGPSAKLMIDRKVVPCAVRIYEQRTSAGLLTTTIWYTPHVYPYILRVEKIQRGQPVSENAAAPVIRESVMLVMETSALRTLRSNRRNPTYTLQTVERAGNTTRITDARCSWDVPGGLLESTTVEFDAWHREVRRSVSRMTNYFSFETPVNQPLRNRIRIPVEVNYLEPLVP